MHSNFRRQATILVIDDEASVVGEVTAALSPSGYTCHGCTSTEVALEMARQITPELIISDINLGGQSGLELCERIKAEDGLREVPLMFLSGAQLPDIIRRSREAGGVYYLRKPFDSEVLIELVEKALWMPHLTATRITRRDQRTAT